MLLSYDMTASCLLEAVDKFIEKLEGYKRQQVRFAKDHAKALRELKEKVVNRTATEADVMSIFIIVDNYTYSYHILHREYETIQHYCVAMTQYLRARDISVIVRFKGEDTKWDSAAEAVDHYYPLMKSAPWGDRIRYEKILAEMSFGKSLCTDGSKPKVKGE